MAQRVVAAGGTGATGGSAGSIGRTASPAVPAAFVNRVLFSIFRSEQPLLNWFELPGGGVVAGGDSA